MDPRDDPSTTTTTTDYDSGDSVSVDYVYEGEKSADSRKTKGRSPRRKRSPRPRPQGTARCTCRAGPSQVEDDEEITVFEETSDTEDERQQLKCAIRSRPSESGGASGCNTKEHHKSDKWKTTERRTRREPSPYIEDYPEDSPRPAIILREHKISRRSSTSDAKRVRASRNRSSSSDSRGRSLPEKPGPPRPSRRVSKEPQRPRHRKAHPNLHKAHQSKSFGSDVLDFQSDTGGPGPTTRFPRREFPEKAAAVARSSAGNKNDQAKYSSSWPLQHGSHLRQRQHTHLDYDSGDGRENELPFQDDDNYDENHRLRRTRAPSFPTRDSERDRSHDWPSTRETTKHERERGRRPSHQRQPKIVSHTSMATMDQGHRSVATSMCEVWRGEAEDWESPYVSASEDDYEPEVLQEPIRLLRMEDLPPRRSSPRLLPPQGDRGDFGFQTGNHPPSPGPYRSPMHGEELSAGAVLGPYNSFEWTYPDRNGCLTLNQPLALTMEPDAMTDDEGNPYHTRPLSRASRWPRPGPPRGWTQPPPPRSCTVSPAFSARATREFHSPKPTRAERFDFGAWGCDRASRISLALRLL
ncbi:hypothetical protein P885DRAFT_32243 [Corynascus similis CBS 632.67]